MPKPQTQGASVMSPAGASFGPASQAVNYVSEGGHDKGHAFLDTKLHDTHRWRDIFPLPVIPDSRAVRGHHLQSKSVQARRGLHRRQFNLQTANAIIEACNSMVGCSHFSCSDVPTEAQQEAQNSILSSVVRNKSVSVCMSKLEAVDELLHTSPSYHNPELAATTVRPYSRPHVSIPSVGSFIPKAADLIDNHGREILLNPSRCMFSDSDSLGDVFDGKPVKPYMDKVLENNYDLYVQFLVDLFSRKMIRFKKHARLIVTPFSVTKKDGNLRLVLDCRATNRLFAPSPDIALAAGFSYASLELPAGENLYVSQSDLKDYFYSLGLPEELQDLFALPRVRRTDLIAAGIDPSELPENEFLYGCMVVVPMGWSWAMWVAQRIHTHQALIGCGFSHSRVISDGKTPPDLCHGEPALLPYADNNNVLGTDQARVQKVKEDIVSHFR